MNKNIRLLLFGFIFILLCSSLASAANVTANFTATPTSGSAPLTVTFNSTSTNAASLQWNFGDGTGNFSDQNLPHTFNTAGTYTVTLTAYNGTESHTTTQAITVNAVSSTAPTASFTANVTEGAAPLSVAFNDTSSGGPTSWAWNFGDGSDNSTLQHPTHLFTSTGTYNVILTATNSDGSNTATKTITIHPKTYFKGDRIWDRDAGQSTNYTWDAKSFSGFFYDLDSGLTSETMSITNIDRTIGIDNLVYRTQSVESDFEHSGWGKYDVIGFMAEKYFACRVLFDCPQEPRSGL